MRWWLYVAVVIMIGVGDMAQAADEPSKTEKVLGGVISGLLGQPQGQSYTTQERDRLVAMLQSGEYATSRQGEVIDVMVYGVPLTHLDHVYTARPIRPSQAYNSPGQ